MRLFLHAIIYISLLFCVSKIQAQALNNSIEVPVKSVAAKSNSTEQKNHLIAQSELTGLSSNRNYKKTCIKPFLGKPEYGINVQSESGKSYLPATTSI